MGSGALGALQRHCDPRDLDAVAISHLHPDHCADLAPLHVYLKQHPDGPSRVTVWGPFGTASRIDQLRGASSHSEVLDAAVWQAGSSVRVGPFTIAAESVVHPVPAYAMRIQGPSELPARGEVVLAYSGDTDVCAGLDMAASGADLFLCEASFLAADHPASGVHLTGTSAGTTAERAGVDRLLLTHIPPWVDPNLVLGEASRVYSGIVELAQPGQRIAI
jgi:ribonuclease BN (tRNA processing enzyme)